MEKKYTQREIGAALKRLDKWERWQLRQNKKRALKYWKECDHVRLLEDVKRREIKKHGAKAAYILSRQSYTIKKAEEVRALLNDSNISKITYFEARTEWKRSRTWGYNPTCQALDNSGYLVEGRASGCGYDKYSAAVDQCLKKSKTFKKAFYIYLLRQYAKKQAPVYASYIDGLYFNFGGAGISAVIDGLEAVGLKKITETGGDAFNYLLMKAGA